MHMSVKLRGIVILMAALVCFALLFSCFFMVFESGHSCCQERCAICCLMSFYRNLIKTVCTALIALGVVMAVFCGHDHNNDYAINNRGILLAYGRYSGGDTVYNDIPNGGRGIVLKEGSRHFNTWVSLKGGERIDYLEY